MLYNNSGAGSSFATHRLVATYFVVNTDPLNNIIVNHIDNNPLNNHFSNLSSVYCLVCNDCKDMRDVSQLNIYLFNKYSPKLSTK